MIRSVCRGIKLGKMIDLAATRKRNAFYPSEKGCAKSPLWTNFVHIIPRNFQLKWGRAFTCSLPKKIRATSPGDAPHRIPPPLHFAHYPRARTTVLIPAQHSIPCAQPARQCSLSSAQTLANRRARPAFPISLSLETARKLIDSRVIFTRFHAHLRLICTRCAAGFLLQTLRFAPDFTTISPRALSISTSVRL